MMTVAIPNYFIVDYMTTPAPTNYFIVDHIVVVCKGCRGERVLWPDKPLQGAREFIAWVNDSANLAPCPCGAPLCDLKAHLLSDDEARKGGYAE